MIRFTHKSWKNLRLSLQPSSGWAARCQLRSARSRCWEICWLVERLEVTGLGENLHKTMRIGFPRGFTCVVNCNLMWFELSLCIGLKCKFIVSQERNIDAMWVWCLLLLLFSYFSLGDCDPSPALPSGEGSEGPLWELQSVCDMPNQRWPRV